MIGGVFNPPIILYSADYEALTENAIYITGWTEEFKGGFLHEMRDLVDKRVLNVRFVHELRDLVDKTQSNTMSTKLQ